MGNKFGLSFSWKRAVGISGLRNRIARKTGVPTTVSGIERKVGRAVGCFVLVAFLLGALATLLLVYKWK